MQNHHIIDISCAKHRNCTIIISGLTFRYQVPHKDSTSVVQCDVQWGRNAANSFGTWQQRTALAKGLTPKSPFHWDLTYQSCKESWSIKMCQGVQVFSSGFDVFCIDHCIGGNSIAQPRYGIGFARLPMKSPAQVARIPEFWAAYRMEIVNPIRRGRWNMLEYIDYLGSMILKLHSLVSRESFQETHIFDYVW